MKKMINKFYKSSKIQIMQGNERKEKDCKYHTINFCHKSKEKKKKKNEKGGS